MMKISIDIDGTFELLEDADLLPDEYLLLTGRTFSEMNREGLNIIKAHWPKVIMRGFGKRGDIDHAMKFKAEAMQAFGIDLHVDDNEATVNYIDSIEGLRAVSVDDFMFMQELAKTPSKPPVEYSEYLAKIINSKA